MKFRAAAAALALGVAGGCASVGAAHADPAPAPPPAPKTTIDGDGTYAVGTDIAPGTYTSAGPAGDYACYWKRTNGSDTIDSAMTKKAQVVRIEPTDTAFKTSHCQPWQLTDCTTGCQSPEASPQDLLGQVLGYLATHRPVGPPPPG